MSVSVSDLLNRKDTNFIYFDIDSDDNIIRVGYENFIRNGKLTDEELNSCLDTFKLRNSLAIKPLRQKLNEQGFYLSKRKCMYRIYNNKIFDSNCSAITLYNGYNYCRIIIDENILYVEESTKLSNLKNIYTIDLDNITVLILKIFKDKRSALIHLIDICFQNIKSITELSKDAIKYLLQLDCITLHNDKRIYTNKLHVTEDEANKYLAKMNCQSNEMQEIFRTYKPKYLMATTFKNFSKANWIAAKANISRIKQQKLNANNLISNVLNKKKTVSDLLNEYIPIIKAQSDMTYYVNTNDLKFYPYWKEI